MQDWVFRLGATQRVEIAEKFQKPAPGVNVINFELNGFNASIWVSWCHTAQAPKSYNALVLKSGKNKMHFAPFFAFQ